MTRLHTLKRGLAIAGMTISGLVLVGALAPAAYLLWWWSFGKVPFP